MARHWCTQINRSLLNDRFCGCKWSKIKTNFERQSVYMTLRQSQHRLQLTMFDVDTGLGFNMCIMGHWCPAIMFGCGARAGGQNTEIWETTYCFVGMRSHIRMTTKHGKCECGQMWEEIMSKWTCPTMLVVLDLHYQSGENCHFHGYCNNSKSDNPTRLTWTRFPSNLHYMWLHSVKKMRCLQYLIYAIN